MEVTDQFLGRLLEVVPPPEQRHYTGSVAGFKAVERELGLELPPGFKELTLAYGHGIWFDTVYILNPFVTWEGNGMPWHARRWGLTGGPGWCDQARKVRRNHPDWFSRYLKDALLLAQHDKCAFCESKVSHQQYGDVEHFRPKRGYKQKESDALGRPGYYWLA